MRNVFVLGSGRSGTSLAAGLLAGAGYHIGDRPIRPTAANPKGFFESEAIEEINERILSKIVPAKPRRLRRWFRRRPGKGQYWLARVPLDARLRGDPEVEARIGEQIHRGPFCFKDPRFCYTLPVWLRQRPDAVQVVVFREPGRTVHSILEEVRTARYLKDYRLDRDDAICLWQLTYRHVLEVHPAARERHFFHYDQLLTDAGLDRLERVTGAAVDRGFADRQLKRSPDPGVPDNRSADLYRRLCMLAGYDGS
jgi:hypothetical protein